MSAAIPASLVPRHTNAGFSEQLLDDTMLDDTGRDGDAWLISYLDMLMLLVTFFVLLLALYGGELVPQDAPIDAPDSAPLSTRPTPLSTSSTPLSTRPAPLSTRPTPLRVPAAVVPTPLPQAPVASFYAPPERLVAAPIASDSGFYTPAVRAPKSPAIASSSTPTTPLHFSVPLFDLASQPTPTTTLPSIEGVEVTAMSDGYTLRIQDHLLFESSAVAVSDAGARLLSELIPLLQDFDGTISVEGHTDSVPIATSHYPSNWELSTARAAAVVRALRQSGLGGSRLRAIGYASTAPLADNDSVAGRARNRRVELVLQEFRDDES